MYYAVINLYIIYNEMIYNTNKGDDKYGYIFLYLYKYNTYYYYWNNTKKIWESK